ncbi:3-methyl-2-oxobutanoate hydroxymethyltransferase [PVC group bacterium (ex Bugula neritina AB1)]|nr:3-methyl-2-oxobutanoate hydroxymethyltransferase [PVC group bacterium (ex Bugula neritina AB1)]
MSLPSINNLTKKYLDKVPIVGITAYDVFMARVVESLDFDIILVGDSLGMVVLGYETTVPVTVEDMIHHSSAVVRGAPKSLVIVDMPFMSYQESSSKAIYNAGRILKETGAQAVKLEGGKEIASTVEKMVTAGIPVMGHLGIQPQSVHATGGYRVSEMHELQKKKLWEDAFALQEAGAFSTVIECVKEGVASELTKELSIPTIGIGSGRDCSGQILVVNDLLGMTTRAPFKFVKSYADLRTDISESLNAYRQDVLDGNFPTKKNAF